MTVLLFAKSQVKGYARKDGTYVKPYTTAKLPPLLQQMQAQMQALGLKGSFAGELPGTAKAKPPSAYSYAQAAMAAAKKLHGFAQQAQAKATVAPPPPAKPKPTPKAYHPKANEQGASVGLYAPHSHTDPATWGDPDQVATFVPGDNHRPYALHGVLIAPWQDHPRSPAGWNQVPGQYPGLDEPPLPDPKGKHLSAGVVVVEDDGRVWTISPSNGFGGYTNTFPKGTLEDGINPQASAIKEAFEESGLQVEITGYLADVERSTSVTRYYRARRVGGDPCDMGWESQAVHLVPPAELANHLKNKYDKPLVSALTGEKSDVAVPK